MGARPSRSRYVMVAGSLLLLLTLLLGSVPRPVRGQLADNSEAEGRLLRSRVIAEPVPNVPQQLGACGGSLEVAADATVDEEQPSAELGADSFLQVYRDGYGQRRTLLAFELARIVPVGATIQRADLELTLREVDGAPPYRMELFGLGQDWSETRVSWDTQPALAASLGIVESDASSGVLSIDVTTLARLWSTGALSPSLALVPVTADGYLSFASREAATSGASVAPRLLIRCAVAAEPVPSDQTADDDRQDSAIRQVRASSALSPELRLERGTLRSALFQLAVPDSANADALTRARWFLDEYRGLLRLDDPARELQLTRRSPDGEHLFFRQLHQDIPIFGAELGVHLDGRHVVGLGGNYLPDASGSPVPRLSAAEAIRLAQVFGGPHMQLVGEPQLLFFNPALLGLEDRTTHLAWQVASTGIPGQPAFFIDADTGELLYTQVREADGFELEYLENGKGNTSDSCWVFASSDEWFDEHGRVDGASPSPEGWRAFNNIKAIDSYWRGQPFNRDSYDADGEEVEMYVHVGNPWQNASYVGGICDLFQFGTGTPVRDVMGHEYNHAIDNYSAELEYVNQSGALDESLADIAGQMQDPGDWLLGEELPASSVPNPNRCAGAPAGTRRNMANPPACGQPDHMLAALSGNTVGLRTTSDPECDASKPGYNDCGFVHTNSGIHNKVAFLLTAGGTHNGRIIYALGAAKTKVLFHGIQTSYLWSSAQFIDARDGAISWTTRYGIPRYGFSTFDRCQILNAYASVGLGMGDQDCDGAMDNVDPDSDGDNVPNNIDNCPTLRNFGQANLDGDSMGDACDTDDDNDGDLDANDNCPLIANANQANWNGDAQGDVCDDSDDDNVVDSRDNCRTVPNSVQQDMDWDGQGDVCDADRDGDGFFNSSDNCPDTFNPAQEDADGDSVGDACDLCPGVKSSDNGDPDGDGRGNPCDDDDDGDGVRDDFDNCPLIANPTQIDRDKNGIGFACDTAEQEWWNGVMREASYKLKTRTPLWSIPVPICPQCGLEVLPHDYRVKINVQLPVQYMARVVDGQGKVVAKLKRGLSSGSLQFKPAPHAKSMIISGTGRAGKAEQTTLGSNTPDSLGYRLEILLAPGLDPDQEYDLELTFTQGQETTVRLPLIQR